MPNNIAISYARFSSEGQADGSSLARQVEAAEAYAAENHLVIDRERSFKDLGVSAWDKSNVRKGALGLFLQAVDAGKIEPGTTLIVESFDRLSRAEPLDALAIFTSIISAGLNIVTLTKPPKLFSRASIKANTFQLFEALLDMHRAHAESERKSELVGNAWKRKRDSAQTGTLMTARAPYWIEVTVDPRRDKADPDKRKATLIPDRVAVIERILDMAEHNVGNHTIIKTLHDEGVPAWSSSGKWQPSYIQKLVHNPALYGGIEIDGTVVPGLFPAIITKERFDHIAAVRAARNSRTSNNRQGEVVTNLFSGRLKCGYCGSSMNIAGYKSLKTGYNRKYVGCLGARIAAPGKCRKMKMWFMDELEPKLLLWLTSLDYVELMGGDKSKLDAAKHVLAGLQVELKEARRRIANTNAAISDSDVPAKSLVKFLDVLDAKEAELATKVAKQEQAVAVLAAQDSTGTARMTALLHLVKALKDTSNMVALRRLREQLSAIIESAVESISMYPAGPTVKGDKSERYLIVKLKNGKTYEVDDSDDNDEAYVVDPVQLKAVEQK